MEGGSPLRTWEKVYWGLFIGGLAFLLYSRLFLSEQKKPDPKASAPARPHRCFHELCAAGWLSLLPHSMACVECTCAPAVNSRYIPSE